MSDKKNWFGESGIVSARMTRAEVTLVEAAANQSGESCSRFIRRVVLEAIQRAIGEPAFK